ncbi:MarR family winged helix-turn-helix transcriptional regulator [Gulosibacter faecalis]|jgi:DNA-binding MarR family transcriptional regulator|uniref:MarR family winged helix-turn-helix transcriptional regulator n=1 Tax=Gulosibacter faecalis TaxID=272240 RepID=A0ABW5UZD7_9MICO|nr:MarR family transcriptional regulator [Gulosibacter faecalis]
MESNDLYRKFRTAARLMRPRGGHPGGPGFPGHPGPHGPAADPTRGQGRILATLKLQDGVPTKDLAFILGMRVASLNEALAKLERAEFVTREPSPDDKRVMLIRLTEAGRNTEQFTPQRPDAFSTLSDDERDQLGALLDRVIEQLESQQPEEDEAPNDEFDRWSERARKRMGDERFEEWIDRMAEQEPEKFERLRRGFERRGRGRGPHGRPHGDPRGFGHGERYHHECRRNEMSYGFGERPHRGRRR